ncbi:MAG: GAK system CofD-like protein [Desulfovibrionaceae bacterium]|nr:GAK system CofD-like protein [Desulfovibrionaceae bacterium]
MSVTFPKLLFFTGGTALRNLSICLAQNSVPSIHLVTMFDSGGSTAELRRSLAIPALGDIRNRMLALADTSIMPKGFLAALSYRCPTDIDNLTLKSDIKTYATTNHPMWHGIDSDIANHLAFCLDFLLQRLPANFNFQGASLGNLILAGLYLHNNRDFGPTLDYLKRVLGVKGTVLPIVDECLNLGCELSDGSFVVGQHQFKNLLLPIRRIFLTVHEPRLATSITKDDICHPKISKLASRWFELANLICYPMGSFYSSVVVNLLVRGVAKRIHTAKCPKVFIPNLGFDPELKDLSIDEQVETILNVLRCDDPQAQTRDLLNYVLIDSCHGDYQGRLTKKTKTNLEQMGLTVIDKKLSASPKSSRHDPQKTLEALVFLANVNKQ